MKRKPIYKTEEVKSYDKECKNRGKIEDNLKELGYRKEEEYNDCVSYLAW